MSLRCLRFRLTANQIRPAVANAIPAMTNAAFSQAQSSRCCCTSGEVDTGARVGTLTPDSLPTNSLAAPYGSLR